MYRKASTQSCTEKLWLMAMWREWDNQVWQLRVKDTLEECNDLEDDIKKLEPSEERKALLYGVHKVKTDLLKRLLIHRQMWRLSRPVIVID